MGLADAAKSVVTDKASYAEYREHVDLRMKFFSDMAGQNFVLFVDSVVGLTTKQWLPVREFGAELFRQGRLHSINFDVRANMQHYHRPSIRNTLRFPASTIRSNISAVCGAALGRIS